jgi:hypothetical protein
LRQGARTPHAPQPHPCDTRRAPHRTQTYEGGIGGEPGNEAHGGYTFCGLAALLLAGRPRALDLPRLLHWAAQRQGWVEGGFNGRTNKLVDGCYSFWQGGVFPLLQELLLQAQHEGGGGTAGGEQSQVRFFWGGVLCWQDIGHTQRQPRVPDAYPA